MDDITLLNLSFRHGDSLQSQWTDFEEYLILPILVSYGFKPVSTIASSKKKSLNNIIIPYNCDSLIIKNRWNMWILIIFLKYSFSYYELQQLVNETNSFYKRGFMLVMLLFKIFFYRFTHYNSLIRTIYFIINRLNPGKSSTR